MRLFVDDVEAVWLALNGLTLVLTIAALIDVRRDRRDVLRSNGSSFRQARLISTASAVRREIVRVIVQLILLGFAIPGLTDDRDLTILNPFVLAFMALALLMLSQTALDSRDRRSMDRAILARWRQAERP